MEHSTIFSSQPSQYVSFVSAFIDEKLRNNEKFQTLVPLIFRAPYPNKKIIIITTYIQSTCSL